MPLSVSLAGIGLHSGAASRITFIARPGPVHLATPGGEAPLDALSVVSTARATTVASRDGRVRVCTIEHALAALGGLGIREGVKILVEGPEVPLIDGGALAFCDAVSALDLPNGAPHLRVARPATFDIGPSRYTFAPGSGVEVTVRVELGASLEHAARWQGDRRDFVDRIAPARTFALAAEIEELLVRGLARHVDPECVVVIGPSEVHYAGRPFSADEPARHKLLDLVGDLYLHGGPPLGVIEAHRPGHAANARAMRRALEEGIVVRASA